MRKYEEVVKPTQSLADITCDKCGNSCRRDLNYEFANMTAYWGYGSRKDEQVFDLDLCEDCFDIFMGWINGGCLRGGISTGREPSSTT